eukprot:11167637-Lingulodinium_polyedra.AAC.1
MAGRGSSSSRTLGSCGRGPWWRQMTCGGRRPPAPPSARAWRTCPHAGLTACAERLMARPEGSTAISGGQGGPAREGRAGREPQGPAVVSGCLDAVGDATGAPRRLAQNMGLSGRARACGAARCAMGETRWRLGDAWRELLGPCLSSRPAGPSRPRPWRDGGSGRGLPSASMSLCRQPTRHGAKQRTSRGPWARLTASTRSCRPRLASSCSRLVAPSPRRKAHEAREAAGAAVAGEGAPRLAPASAGVAMPAARAAARTPPTRRRERRAHGSRGR